MFIRTTFLLASACLWFSTSLCAQTIDSTFRAAGPKGDVSVIIFPFLQIPFSPVQKKALSNVSLVVKVRIDELGHPTLEQLNGTEDPAIIDSLRKTFPRIVHEFRPGVEQGRPAPGYYSFTVPMPTYPIEQRDPLAPTSSDEILSYTQSGRRLDFLAGVVANGYQGSAASFQNPGAGVKIDLMYTPKSFGVGITAVLWANDLKKNYTISSTRDPSKHPVTILVGLALNKVVHEWARSEFIMQVELNYATEEITPRLYNGDHDFVTFNGWSPGLVGNFLIRIGKDKFGSESVSVYYAEPALYCSYINLHAALRPLYLSSKEASGLIFEFGVSYRFSSRFLKAYVRK